MIDENDNNLGVMTTEKALGLAKEKGLDLIEIVPTARPPVARILSFDKFRYRQKKEERKKQQKTKEMKGVRISPRAAKNDLEMKAKKAKEFLDQGHRVQVNLFLKGREKVNKEWGLQKLNDFLEMIDVPINVVMEPKYVGRGFVVQIVKK